jgi:predicted nucleic acid-binding Zn ribbon protein
MADPRPLGDGLDQVLRSLGAPKASALRTVFTEWHLVVGADIAAHAKPLSLEEGRLLIGVDEPGWATQLRYLNVEILSQLAAALGEGVVTRIDVRVLP